MIKKIITYVEPPSHFRCVRMKLDMKYDPANLKNFLDERKVLLVDRHAASAREITKYSWFETLKFPILTERKEKNKLVNAYLEVSVDIQNTKIHSMYAQLRCKTGDGALTEQAKSVIMHS